MTEYSNITNLPSSPTNYTVSRDHFLLTDVNPALHTGACHLLVELLT